MSTMTTLKLVHGRNKATTCDIFQYGATVISWKVDGEEMLYLSSKSAMDGSKAVRGGIPLCFPNFGPWQFGAQHGFARTSSNWKIQHPPQVDGDTGDVKTCLMLSDTEATRSIWNHKFEFLFTVTLKEKSLQLEADVFNKGSEKLDLTFCFHTYLKVPDVRQCTLHNFKGLTYVDKTQEGCPEVEETNDYIQLSDFTDRVYNNAPNAVQLRGLANKRTLRFTKEGLTDFVVWNPWDKNKLADMGETDYNGFICVEAAQNSRRIHIGREESWTANHTITVEDH